MKLKQIIASGLAIGLAFTLFGCSKRAASSYEEVAQSALNQKYERKFVVEELVQRGTENPIPDQEYTGYAYEASNPDQKFQVWVSKDKKTVTDNYQLLTFLPELDEWLTEQADQIWPGAMVHTELDTFDAYDLTGIQDAKSFYEKTMVNNQMIVCIPSDTDLTDMKHQVKAFYELVGEHVYGMGFYYLVDRAEINLEDLKDIPEQYQTTWNIGIGASDTLLDGLFP